MSDQSQAQRDFTRCLGQLLVWAAANGYELTGGEWYRPPEMAEIYAARGIGIKQSVHTMRLAVDFNLFRDGIYQQQSEAYQPLGEHWKSLNPLARWGGDLQKKDGTPRPDGNHFAFF